MKGAILAGGAGTRLGGAKALAPLGGRPLVLHVLAALARVVELPVAVIVKPETGLPPLPPGVAVRVEEPDGLRHPLVGIRAALDWGAPVLCCAVDLPLITDAVLRALAGSAPARVAVPLVDGRREPACAVWTAAALPRLVAAAPGARLHDVLDALDPLELPVAAPGDAFLNVNTPADLQRAAAVLSRR